MRKFAFQRSGRSEAHTPAPFRRKSGSVVDVAHLSDRQTAREVNLGFAAFVQLNQHLYTRYARARLSEETTTEAVISETFAAVRERWPWFLSQPCPAADVWSELRYRVNREAAKTKAPAADPLVKLYEALSHCCADSVVLCLRLGLNADDAAGLMGVERPAVETALGAARRAQLHAVEV
ncbi:hypothetical protein ACFTZI_05615 [Streptomyces decoyicus]|uniref:hypothetical protein n=1 Tax=Streptomyces decoyicus TaxID=249567 RepID=UPI003644B8B5